MLEKWFIIFSYDKFNPISYRLNSSSLASINLCALVIILLIHIEPTTIDSITIASKLRNQKRKPFHPCVLFIRQLFLQVIIIRLRERTCLGQLFFIICTPKCGGNVIRKFDLQSVKCKRRAQNQIEEFHINQKMTSRALKK